MNGSRVAGALLVLALVGAGSTATASAAPQSTTALVLSATRSAYGQTVTASAQVTTPDGPADGDVFFTMDGTAVRANVSGGGTASIVLPRDALVGEHAVSATFVPRFPASQTTSTSPIVAWTVAQVRTRLQVRVIGRGVRIPTSVQVGAAGDYGSRPTGRVKLVVRRKADGQRSRVVERLSSTAAVVVGLGKLKKGAYRLETTYVGDSQHLRERRVQTFRVGRP
jgi:hypothetical protein